MTTTEKKKARSPHQPTGCWIRAEKRLALYLRGRFTCLACGRDLHDADPRDVTLDHIVPKADGGTNRETNLYTCCRTCNCARQDKPISRFLSPEARAHVRRNVRRQLRPYVVLAKAILAGETPAAETP